MKLFTKTLSMITALSLSAAIVFSGCGAQEPQQDTTAAQTTEATTTAATQATEATTATTDDSLSPLLWKVTGEKGNTLYLFGTIHVGDERNEAVMNQIADKVDECDTLAVECDIVAFQEDMAKMISATQLMLYSDGTNVKDHMKPELYEKCVEYLAQEGASNALYDYYNLAFWNTLLQQTEISKTDFDLEQAMDTLLLNYAKDNGKEIDELESVEFQYNLENSFSDDWYNLMIESFFENIDEFDSSLTELYEAWATGDEEKIVSLSQEDLDNDTEATEEEKEMAAQYVKGMYTDRNNGMTTKAEEYLKNGKSVFLAVGAAHMVGDTGIVKQLTDKGYKVERVSA